MARLQQVDRQVPDWTAAAVAGLGAGAILMVLDLFWSMEVSGAGPWGASRMIAAIVMGPDVLQSSGFSLSAVVVALLLHYTFGVIGGLVFAALMSFLGLHGSPGSTLLIGAAFGFVLYMINFYGMAMVFPWFVEVRGWPTMSINLIFGIATAALYLKLEGRGEPAPEAASSGRRNAMGMQRHYFISDSLDDLELFEQQLEAAGVASPQIHVLSSNDAEAANHRHVNTVRSLMRSDLVHSTTRGAVVGVAAFILVLGIAYVAGWTETAAGWVPFIFLAVLLLGFCTWEGGLSGIQRPNHHFVRFAQVLKEGKHVFFVDLERHQEPILERVVASHPGVENAGTAASPAQHWIIALQQRLGIVRQAL